MRNLRSRGGEVTCPTSHSEEAEAGPKSSLSGSIQWQSVSAGLNWPLEKGTNSQLIPAAPPPQQFSISLPLRTLWALCFLPPTSWGVSTAMPASLNDPSKQASGHYVQLSFSGSQAFSKIILCSERFRLIPLFSGSGPGGQVTCFSLARLDYLPWPQNSLRHTCSWDIGWLITAGSLGRVCFSPSGNLYGLNTEATWCRALVKHASLHPSSPAP